MKIERNQIRISGPAQSLDALRNLKEGSRLAVKITERLGQRQAVLDIGGSRVNAEFIQGVPKSGNLFLILDNKTGGTLYFRIADGYIEDDLMVELSKSTIINRNDLNKSIYKLRLFLKEGMYSIFMLNKTLLKYNDNFDKNKNVEKLLSLLNKLLSQGADYKNLVLVAVLLNHGKNRAADFLYLILSRIFPDYKEIFKKDNITKRIADFIDLLNKSIFENDKDDKLEVIRSLLELTISDSKDDNRRYGEILFFDEHEFKLCRYILNENNIVLSLDLSYLGSIDIVIKHDKSFCSVVFYCENDDSIAVLKSESKLLESALDFDGKTKIHIGFLNNKKAVKKIIEIISNIELNNLIDAKA